MTTRKCKVLIVYYDEEKEADLRELLREPTKRINNEIGEIINPFSGDSSFIEDLVYSMIMRASFSEGG